jgi:diguanylate cyclase (GGDEF)-like protein
MMTLSPFSAYRGRGTPAEQRVEALHRVVSILLQGVALHGFEYERQAFERFQLGIRKIRANFDELIDDDTAVLLSGAAIRLMEDHGRHSEHFLQTCRTETEAMMALLSDTLSHVTGAGPETIVGIKEAQRDFAHATQPEEMTAARCRLASCLETIRQCPRGKASAPELVPGKHDSATGLPDSGYAEAAFASVWSRRHEYYVAIFAFERLEAINLRFGFKVGDEVLSMLSQHVAQNIRAGDNLFRWRGPCLVVLIERQAHESLVASELSRIASVRLEHAIKIKDREVLVPVSMSWHLLPLGGTATVDELVTDLNAFASNRARQLR